MMGAEGQTSRASFPEFYARRELRHWVPTISQLGVPVREMLTGDELTLTFGQPEFDPPIMVSHIRSLNDKETA